MTTPAREFKVVALFHDDDTVSELDVDADVIESLIDRLGGLPCTTSGTYLGRPATVHIEEIKK